MHDCQPPSERHPSDNLYWTCPDCGARWSWWPRQPMPDDLIAGTFYDVDWTRVPDGAHLCRPPMERRSIEDDEWICPDCGDVWKSEPMESTDPAPHFDFGTGQHWHHARWVRIGPPS